MAAVSPLVGADGVLQVTVFSNGTALPESALLIRLEVTQAVNRIAAARLEFVDGDMSEGKFPLSDGDHLKPGAAIRIDAGYEGDDAEDAQCLFDGIVVGHGLRISDGNSARLVVECRDRAAMMAAGRISTRHADKTDSEIIRGILSAYPLHVGGVEDTFIRHDELLQHDRSNWDFIVARAEANGLLVLAGDGTVDVKSPMACIEAPPTLGVTWGMDLIAFDATLDARTQYASVQAISWDASTQAQHLTGEQAAPIDLLAQGNVGAAELAKVLKLPAYRLYTADRRTEAELTRWAEALQRRSALARIRGHVSFQGSAKAVPGCTIELASVGDRFSGNAFVGGVTHRIGDGNWLTEVTLGLAPWWSAE